MTQERVWLASGRMCSKVAQEKREQRDAAVQLYAAVAKITGAPPSPELNNTFKQEVSGINPELLGMIESFDKAVLERQAWLLRAQKSHS